MEWFWAIFGPSDSRDHKDVSEKFFKSHNLWLPSWVLVEIKSVVYIENQKEQLHVKVRPLRLLFLAFQYKTSGSLLKVKFGVFLHILAWYSHTKGKISLWLIWRYIIWPLTSVFAFFPTFFTFIIPLLVVGFKNVKLPYSKSWGVNLV